MEKPKIVSAEEWQQARDELLKAEEEDSPPAGRNTQVTDRYAQDEPDQPEVNDER